MLILEVDDLHSERYEAVRIHVVFGSEPFGL